MAQLKYNNSLCSELKEDTFYLTDSIASIQCDANILQSSVETLQDQIKELKEAFENLRNSLTGEIVEIASKVAALTENSKEKSDLEIFDIKTENMFDNILDW